MDRSLPTPGGGETPPSQPARRQRSACGIRTLAARGTADQTDDFGNVRSQNGTTVPEKFMESASAAVQKSTRLEQSGGADATTLRDAYAYAYAIAFDPAVQEVIALGKFLAHTIRQQRVSASDGDQNPLNLAHRKEPGHRT